MNINFSTLAFALAPLPASKLLTGPSSLPGRLTSRVRTCAYWRWTGGGLAVDSAAVRKKRFSQTRRDELGAQWASCKVLSECVRVLGAWHPSTEVNWMKRAK